VKIRNVVTTANLDQDVDITRFVEFSWGIYDLVYYGGRCGYIKYKLIKGRVTVFKSGKMISVGATSISESIKQLYHAMDLLVEAKFIRAIGLEPTVRNIVATTEVCKIDLTTAVSGLDKLIYEPEQFPAAILKTPIGPTCLIFESGKIVIAGAKSEKQVIDTEISLLKLLNPFLIRNKNA
jgi:TATA-box binding protein (TBP) (component of TFIID and TFIIIB)